MLQSPKPLTEAIDATIAWLETNPTNRTIGYPARNRAGEPVPVNSPDAVCFCALGYLAQELGSTALTSQDVWHDLGQPDQELFARVWINNDANYGHATIQALKELKCHIPST